MRTSHVIVNGVRYAYCEAGEGPLLLLGHGTFGAKELLRPQLEALSSSYRCIAFDWPGHGQSGFRPEGWGARDLVEDVQALIAALGERSAFLAGVSQGGAVFSRVALTYPELVRGLVIMCAGPGVPPPAAVARLRDLARVLSEETDESVRRQAATDFASALFHAPDFSRRDPERAKLEIDLMLAHPRSASRLVAEVPASYDSITARLGEIRCPVLVIWGDKDGRPMLGAEIAAAIPDAQLRVIKNAGHHVNVDAPEETSRVIEAFLRGIVRENQSTASSYSGKHVGPGTP